MSIIKKPLITEKGTALNEKGVYGFVVSKTANKVEIKQIVFLNNHAFNDEKLKNIFAETKEGNSMNFLSSGTFENICNRVVQTSWNCQIK